MELPSTPRFRLPNGYMRKHIETSLVVLCAAGVDDIAKAVPRHMRTAAVRSNVRSAIYALIKEGVVIKVLPDTYCLADYTPTWLDLFKFTKSHLFHVLAAAEGNWTHRSEIERHCARFNITAKKAGDGMRWLHKRGLMEKDRRSFWVTTRKVKEYIDPRDIR